MFSFQRESESKKWLDTYLLVEVLLFASYQPAFYFPSSTLARGFDPYDPTNNTLNTGLGTVPVLGDPVGS
jgi:hypothetical protein